ncbi:hypothetical protein ERJ75_001292200 [Trypanosoma vivax]|nr:hypothetical protein ERJ75_001293400 [Trypanosoma vivax]KAH8608582.1 hypothetical protein ERJ75_001292200 [Trypanosoma vivax]
MMQKRPEKQLLSGAAEAQDAPGSDGETGQEAQDKDEFVREQCRRVLESRARLTRHKCEAASIINSADSNVAEWPVTAARSISGKECRYRRLLRHMRAKHPGRDEPLRPQPRAKPKRKGMRTEALAQGEWSGPLESAGGGDVNAERPRKRRRVGCHTEWKEGRDHVRRQVRRRAKAVVRACLAHARASQARCDSEAEDEGRHGSGDTSPATIAPVPKLPSEARARAVPRNAPAGEARATETGSQVQLAEGEVRGVCGAPPGVPKLARTKEEART